MPSPAKSPDLGNSGTSDGALAFPSPSGPLRDSHLRGTISWADYMDEIASYLDRYLRLHDRPEDRLATKIRERFVM